MSQITTIVPPHEGPIHADVVKSIRLWATRKHEKVHKLLDILLKNNGKMRVSMLCYLLDRDRISNAPLTAINNLTTNSGHAYGKVLKSDGDFVSILPQYLPIFKQCWPAA